jgi:hypothetical protein
VFEGMTEELKKCYSQICQGKVIPGQCRKIDGEERDCHYGFLKKPGMAICQYKIILPQRHKNAEKSKDFMKQ